jgi:hypothetical protein
VFNTFDRKKKTIKDTEMLDLTDATKDTMIEEVSRQREEIKQLKAMLISSKTEGEGEIKVRPMTPLSSIRLNLEEANPNPNPSLYICDPNDLIYPKP